MKKNFSLNFDFFKNLKNRLFKKSSKSEDLQEIHEEHIEYESENAAEEFAEKTLSDFRFQQSEETLHEEDEEIEYIEEEWEEATEEDVPSFTELRPNKEVTSEANVHHEIQNDSEHFEHVENKNDEISQIMTENPMPKKPTSAKLSFKFPSFSQFKFERQPKELKNPKVSKGTNRAIQFKSILTKFEKISWNEIIQKLFSPYSRRRIHYFFLIFIVGSFTYFAGKSLALFLGRQTKLDVTKAAPNNLPVNNSESNSTDILKIASTNLFNIKQSEQQVEEKPKIDIDAIVCLEGTKPTTTPIKLIDTIVLQDSVKSVASVQMRGAQELLDVREGERLDNAVEISKIDRMRLVLKNLTTGDCEYVKSENADKTEEALAPIKVLPASMASKIFKSMNPNIKNEGNTFKIKKAFRDDMISKMSEVLTQARAIQITNPDGTICFKMTEIVAGSIYSQLNIQENDIICQVNGKKIENLNDLMSMLGRIKEIDNMQISLKRNGSNENLDYNFE